MKSKHSKALKGKKFKQHIKALYLERLQNNEIFAGTSNSSGRIKIISRRTTVEPIVEINEGATARKLLKIKKVSKNVASASFNLLPKPNFCF